MPTKLTFAVLSLSTLAAASAFAQDRGGEPGGPGSAPEAAGSFYDDFSGETLDRSRWFVADGWVNSDDHDCAWSARTVRKPDETLILTIEEEAALDREYVCAEVQSEAVYGHGTYEARVRTAEGSGVMSAFFTYTGPYFDDPHDEIDFEWPGARPSTVELNVWKDGSDGPGAEAIGLEIDPTAEFHDYAFEWTPDAVRWYIDGVLVGEVTDPERLPTTPGKIYLNLYSGREGYVPWLGRFDESVPTPTMEVDHVAYTAPGDECQFPGSIVCERDR